MNMLTMVNENCVDMIKARHGSSGVEATVLTDIFQSDINIAIWQRNLTGELTQAAEHIINDKPFLKGSEIVTPESAFSTVTDVLGEAESTKALREDISQLVEMFCDLFDLKSVGLRLTTLDRAMCPRFHVDRVPCRLVTTYHGIATDWLSHENVDRSKLGSGNQGKPDEQSGVYINKNDINKLAQGDVALLKGELWEGNDGAGLVHRSPSVPKGESRLLVTLDFVNE